MAASRNGDYKMIRVEDLGYRLYDLKGDLGEARDLSKSHPALLSKMILEMEDWEDELMVPLWIESSEWNEVTWWVHRDLYNNVEVQATNPQQLRRIKERSE